MWHHHDVKQNLPHLLPRRGIVTGASIFSPWGEIREGFIINYQNRK